MTPGRKLLCWLGVMMIVALSLFGPGCATTGAGRVSVPVVPAWLPPANAASYTALDVTNHAAIYAPGAGVDLSDSTFTPLSHEWLLAAVDWAWSFGKATGIAYTPESFDCDKFALSFSLAANVAASRAGVRAQPLLARIYVQQQTAFAGVAAGGGHALNAFLSDRAPYFWVLEPQPGGAKRLVPLMEYPNRSAIFRIKIGG